MNPYEFRLFTGLAVVGVLSLVFLVWIVFYVVPPSNESRRANTQYRSSPPKPQWEVKLEAEIEALVRHSELAKRMSEKYAPELQDEELAKAVKRLLERRRVEIVTGDTAG